MTGELLRAIGDPGELSCQYVSDWLDGMTAFLAIIPEECPDWRDDREVLTTEVNNG